MPTSCIQEEIKGVKDGNEVFTLSIWKDTVAVSRDLKARGRTNSGAGGSEELIALNVFWTHWI